MRDQELRAEQFISSLIVATALAAVGLCAVGFASAADAAPRDPGLEELWEEFPLDDAELERPAPRERLPGDTEAKPGGAPPERPRAVPQAGGSDATIGATAWIAIVAVGVALLVAGLGGALVYAGHAPRRPPIRLPGRPSVRPRQWGREIAVAATNAVRSARAASSRLIPATERSPTADRVVNDLVRAASAAIPRHRSKEAKMVRTRDRAGQAAEIDVLKAKPQAAEGAKHTMAGPGAEAEALKRKPSVGSTDALKAKVAGDSALDKNRLAASDAVALKEKLSGGVVEPKQAPKPRQHPVRAAPRTSRTKGRRALRSVATPEFAPVQTEARETPVRAERQVCEVRWWRGYVKSQFSAIATEPDGTEVTIASSPYFRWHKSVPPQESPAAEAALRTLVETLERDGWIIADRGAEWFAVTFRREFSVEGIETAGRGSGT